MNKNMNTPNVNVMEKPGWGVSSTLGPVRKVKKTESGVSKPVSLYTELLKKVKNAGLLNKKPSHYIKFLTVISLLSLAAWAGVWAISLTNNWAIQLTAIPVMIVLGMLTSQYGFIAHEASHRQVFANNKWNDTLGLILANGFAGFSQGFWLAKHNKHHSATNSINEDPDIQIAVLSFYPEQLQERKGVEKVLAKNQGWLFPFLLLMTAFHLLIDSFIALGHKSKHATVGRKILEFAIIIIRQALPIVILFVLFPPIVAGILWLTYMFATGFNLGASFALNHKGMPLIAEGQKVDFFSRQVLTSRNVKSSWYKDILLGFLNYQVEHHLFSNANRTNVKQIHKIVKEYCKEVNIPLTETTFFKGFADVMRYLDKVGLSESNPFECPMVVAYKP